MAASTLGTFLRGDLSAPSTPTLTDGMTAAHFDDVVARARGDPEHGPWGIEEELMILDPESFALVNAIEELLEDGRERELDQARAA